MNPVRKAHPVLGAPCAPSVRKENLDFMNPILLANNGTLWSGDRPMTGDPLAYLGCPVVLAPEYSLRCFFRLLDGDSSLKRLNSFTNTYLAQVRQCPTRGCTFPGIEAVELSRVLEMTGYPGTPAVRIYVTLEGVGPDGRHDIEGTGLDRLLDMPLRLGRLKHTIFGDRIDAMEFDTVFNLFELIDGICWELSFHNLPDRCRYK